VTRTDPGGQVLRIEVVDHVILGRRTDERPCDYVSLRQLGSSPSDRSCRARHCRVLAAESSRHRRRESQCAPHGLKHPPQTGNATEHEVARRSRRRPPEHSPARIWKGRECRAAQREGDGDQDRGWNT